MDGVAFRQAKPLLLLAYLTREGPQARRHLTRLFWPDAGDPSNRLSVTLRRLRTGIPGAVTIDGDTLSTALPCDATLLERLLRRGRIDVARRLHSGGFLVGAPLPVLGEELEEWIFLTRERLQNRLKAHLLDAAEIHAAAGAFERAGELAEDAWSVPGPSLPDTEDLRRIYLLLRAGSHPAAREVAGEASAIGLDLSPYERDDARRELRRAGRAGSRPDVRVPSTLFVGREAERAALGRLLHRRDRRLITLTGAGGQGKSRLALHVAHDALESGAFPGGVLFVELEETADAGDVPLRVVEALSAPVPARGDPLAYLGERTDEAPMLWVLDNLEHLAPDSAVIAEMLRRCPRVTILATSREPLRLTEEWVMPLGGLAPPPADAADAEEWPAARLFAARARQARPSYRLDAEDVEAVATIARLTGGSPLALEMAAGWTSVAPAATIADELERDRDLFAATQRDRPERHRSLRAVFLHSWRLLPDDERGALRRLAVFRGGFDLQGARAVAGAGLAALEALSAKSLLMRTSADRFGRHPLLHGFTEEKLAEDPGELERTREAHARHFLAFAEEARPRLDAVGGLAWMERLERDHDNFRAALGWAEEGGRDDLLVRLSDALVEFWIRRGHHAEARRWFERIARRGEHVADGRRLARSLLRYAFVCFVRGDFGTPPPLLEKSQSIALRLGDRSGEARALSHRGMLDTFRGRYEEARGYFRAALRPAREAGDRDLEGRILNNLADAHAYGGEPVEAAALYRECLAIEYEVGDFQMVSNVLGALGMVQLELGHEDEARRSLRKSLDLVDGLGISYGRPTVLDQVGCLAAAADRSLDAARLWGAAERARESLNVTHPIFMRGQIRPWLARARAASLPASFARAWDEGRTNPPDALAAEVLNGPGQASRGSPGGATGDASSRTTS